MALTNASDAYFGSYVRFQTTDKQAGGALAGPDNAVGDIGEIVWQLDERKRQQAWLKNPYGHLIGHLDEDDSYKLALYQAKGWIIRYVLSFTAYSEEPAPGIYWGQAAVFAYPERHKESFDEFVHVFSNAAANGSRPDPSMNAASVERVLADPSGWKPSSKVKLPQGDGRTVILKDHRSIHDKMLDKGRSGNIGCYIVSWAFILALLAAGAWALHAMGLF